MKLSDGLQMTNAVIAGAFLIVAAIHLIPLIGVLGSEKLNQLYGLSIADPNIEILMRHRAVLFGILGCLFGTAAFKRLLRPYALLAGFLSVVSFLVLTRIISDYGEGIQKIVIADYVALVALVLAAVAMAVPKRG